MHTQWFYKWIHRDLQRANGREMQGQRVSEVGIDWPIPPSTLLPMSSSICTSSDLRILKSEKDSRSPVCRVLCQGLGAFSIPCLIAFPSNSLPKDDSALDTDYKDSLGYRLWKNWRVRLISPRIASGGERSLNLSLWWLNWRNGHITLHLPCERETHILQRTGILAPWE